MQRLRGLTSSEGDEHQGMTVFRYRGQIPCLATKSMSIFQEARFDKEKTVGLKRMRLVEERRVEQRRIWQGKKTK